MCEPWLIVYHHKIRLYMKRVPEMWRKRGIEEPPYNYIIDCNATSIRVAQ